MQSAPTLELFRQVKLVYCSAFSTSMTGRVSSIRQMLVHPVCKHASTSFDLGRVRSVGCSGSVTSRALPLASVFRIHAAAS